MNEKDQKSLLLRVFPLYKEEYNFSKEKTAILYQYYLKNPYFGPVSAEVLHCMIRHFSPRKIIEIGSGYSTYVSARACLFNKPQTKLTVVDPYPNETVRNGFPGLSTLVTKKVEEIDLEFFLRLDDRDILFIDSSHVIRMGEDVNFLYLEVLPRLKKGAIVHIHDIFFPYEYPETFVLKDRVFYTEQYLLQAFLTYNYAFKILWCASYMHLKYPSELASTFPSCAIYGKKRFSSSFWMQKLTG